MTQRQHEPEKAVTLTGATNGQEFPARVTPEDKAQADDRKRVQATKAADYQRQVTEAQREALEAEPVRLKDRAGTVVTASGKLAETLKAQGYTEA